MKDMKELVKLVSEVIDRGATTVEEVHKAIMDQPYEVIEKVAPSLEEPTRKVKNIQDRTVGTIYNLIRSVNRDVAAIAQELLERKQSATNERPPPEQPPPPVVDRVTH